MNTKWSKFIIQFKEDLKCWFFFIVLFQILRFSFCGILSQYISKKVQLIDLLLVSLVGLRYDAVWSIIFILPFAIFISIPAIFIKFKLDKKSKLNTMRIFWVGICSTIAIILYMISIEYYKEYHDIFNQFLFGLIYDDTKAIMQTVAKDYHLLEYSSVLLIYIISYFKIFRKIFFIGALDVKSSATKVKSLEFDFKHSVVKMNNKLNNNKFFLFKKIGLSLLVVVFYVGSFRGGLGRRPIQLKDAGICEDPFLNKVVVSPFSALRYAIKDHGRIASDNHGEKYLKDKTIRDLAKEYFNNNTNLATLDDYMKKKVEENIDNFRINKPKHIFVIVGESLDAWSLKKKYEQFELTNNLKQFAKKGIYIKNFLPGSVGTMASLNTIITGLPDCGLLTNYQVTSNKPYSTASALQFKKLGYKTQFFYGGYLSWQRLGDFAKNQGFDEVFGAPHMSNWLSTNEWGVDDRSLYDFIEGKLSNNTPSYNVIMTTSNHPPFNVDLQKEGFNIEKCRQLLKNYPNSPASLKQLGHLWYTDKTIKEFITKLEKKYPSAIFVITGDHYGRRHVLPNPPLFDSNAVPLIIYGNNIANNKSLQNIDFSKISGSHIDIVDTIIGLFEKNNFEYYSMGKNLLSKAYKESDFIGIGKHAVITSKYIVEANSIKTIQSLKKSEKNNVLNLKNNTVNDSDIKSQFLQNKDKYHQAMGIAWWRIVKGEHLN